MLGDVFNLFLCKISLDFLFIIFYYLYIIFVNILADILADRIGIMAHGKMRYTPDNTYY